MAARVQTGRFQELVKRAFSLKASNILGTALEDIFSVFPLVDPSEPTLLRLRGERLFGIHRAVGAVVGQFSQVALINSPNSGVLIVVNAFFALSAATVQFDVQSIPPAPDGTSSIPFDTRDDSIEQRTLVGSPIPGFGGLPGAAGTFRGADPGFGLFPRMVLKPNRMAVWSTGSVNSTLDVTAWYTTRAFEQSEL